MANAVGSTVSRLIRQRSYAGGDLKAIEKRLEQASASLRKAQAEHRAVRREQRAALKKIAALDDEIAGLSAIRSSDIYPRKATPKLVQGRWGAIISEIVRLLRDTGTPLTTTQIVTHMVGVFNFPLSTPSERRHTRKWVTAKLQHLARRGAVERLHDTTDNVLGLWLWIGL